MDHSLFSEFIPAARITVTDPFWKKEMELVRKEVIPYQYEALHDRIEGAEKSWAVDNFRKAGNIAKLLKEGKEAPVFPVNDWAYNDETAHPDAFHGWRSNDLQPFFLTFPFNQLMMLPTYPYNIGGFS